VIVVRSFSLNNNMGCGSACHMCKGRVQCTIVHWKVAKLRVLYCNTIAQA
jgi:hypothetical protein